MIVSGSAVVGAKDPAHVISSMKQTVFNTLKNKSEK